ncbi:hypothetical protein [Alistipes sp.]|uniref:hypothetical protein n=1 Tax=Alistipes sp. TaxID=1872444 RepID=UPI003A8B0FA4
MTNESKTMFGNLLRRSAVLIAGAFVSAVLPTGCIYDEELDFPYTVGIESYSYTGQSGGSLTGPMDYLSGLGIADRFTITAETEGDADAQARFRFEAEMARIDPAALDASALGGAYRFRFALRPEGCTRVLAEREFASR